MADNYLERRQQELQQKRPVIKRSAPSLDSLLKKNRSYRGFDQRHEVSEDELKQGNLSVHVNNVYMQANVNLENGEVKASGSIGSIKAYATSALSFSAIVVPQEIRKLTVVWNNVEYDLGFSKYCDRGRLYSVTATLKKASGGISVTIGGWEDSGEDFGGTVN